MKTGPVETQDVKKKNHAVDVTLPIKEPVVPPLLCTGLADNLP